MHSDAIGITHDVSPEKVHRAQMIIASYAHDKEDLKELLMMLGLMPQDFHYHTTSGGGNGESRRKRIEGSSLHCDVCT